MCHDRFPGVDKWICMMHQLIGNDRFAYLLQKTESYLMLEVICREFHEKHPSAPVFTIHDAICTLPQYLPDLKELILERFPEITGAKVGLKSSLLTPELKSKPEEIDEEWQKIRPVNTLEKFMEISFYVFPGNIEKGSEFLDKK